MSKSSSSSRMPITWTKAVKLGFFPLAYLQMSFKLSKTKLFINNVPPTSLCSFTLFPQAGMSSLIPHPTPDYHILSIFSGHWPLLIFPGIAFSPKTKQHFSLSASSPLMVLASSPVHYSRLCASLCLSVQCSHLKSSDQELLVY